MPKRRDKTHWRNYWKYPIFHWWILNWCIHYSPDGVTVQAYICMPSVSLCCIMLTLRPCMLQACDRLLSQRVEVKLKGKKVNEVINRLHLAVPAKRDDKVRRCTFSFCISFLNLILCTFTNMMMNSFVWFTWWLIRHSNFLLNVCDVSY